MIPQAPVVLREGEPPLALLAALPIIQVISIDSPGLDEVVKCIPAVFLAGAIPTHPSALATSIWDGWVLSAQMKARTDAQEIIERELRLALIDTQSSLR